MKKHINKLLFLHLKHSFILIIIFTLIESLGPIIFNIEHGISIKHIFSVLSFSIFNSAVIIGFISLIGQRHRLIYLFILITYAILSYANLLHMRAFNIYLPINMLFEFQQLNGLGGSIYALMRQSDICYLILCAIGIFYYFKSKRNDFNYKFHIASSTAYILLTLIPVLFITSQILGWSLNNLKKSYNYAYNNNPLTCYKGFGLLPILTNQLSNSMHSNLNITDNIRVEIDNLLKENINHLSIQHNISHKQNIVIILSESLNTACITPQFMPYLYAASQEANSLYCPKMRQLSQGAASIGGQLVTMTGLSGLRQTVFCVDHPLNTYPSIATEMCRNKDSYVYTVTSAPRYYWRQNIVSKSLGMTNLFDQSVDMPNSALNINGWVDDKVLFDFACKKIPSDKAFCALLITSNMHIPYSFDNSIAQDSHFPNITDPLLHEYMRRARYLDDQIASFVQSLKKQGVYDDTLIVIAPDHQVPSAYYSDAMRKYLSPYIPAIFINTGEDWTEQNKRNKDVVFCHSQVYPTMLQLMGLRPEKYAGLFPPMTNIEATQEYDFDNCDYATTTDERLKRIYDLEELIIRGSYFGTMK